MVIMVKTKSRWKKINPTIFKEKLYINVYRIVHLIDTNDTKNTEENLHWIIKKNNENYFFRSAKRFSRTQSNCSDLTYVVYVCIFYVSKYVSRIGNKCF